VDETDVVSLSYNGDLNETTVELTGIRATVTNLDHILVVCRTSGDRYKRGHVFPVVARDGTKIVVSGEIDEDVEFYAGFKIVSRLRLTRPTVTVDDQPRILERTQIGVIDILHAATGYYRVRVGYENGDTKEYAFEARTLGDPDNELDIQPIVDGSFQAPIRAKSDAFDLVLVNDSYLPSQWQSAQWSYEPTTRLDMPGVTQR
jgi:hypothetical protein